MSQHDGRVTVRFFAAAKAAAGCNEATAAPGTLPAILAELTAAHSQLATVLPACSFLVDGAQPPRDPRSALVSAGATLDVLPPFAGG